MESSTTDSSGGSVQPQPNLPPGFRFHPTDEELVVHYLKRKATSVPLPVPIIADVDLYKFDPWELPAKAAFGEQEWYFFSPRDRKYPNGARPNRAATSGYWKATGTDKPIISSNGTQKVGVKKALVFYGGKPPKGVKTNWIMHEYRLADSKPSNHPPIYAFNNKKNSLRLDDWVLCRIYKKHNTGRHMDNDKDDLMEDMFRHNTTERSGFFTTNNNTNHALLDAFMINNTELVNHTNIGSVHLGSSSNPNQQSPHMLSTLKRASPPQYWPEDDVSAADSSAKRFHVDCSNFSSLVGQTPPLANQPAVISTDGMIFRSPYPVAGLNWFT